MRSLLLGLPPLQQQTQDSNPSLLIQLSMRLPQEGGPVNSMGRDGGWQQGWCPLQPPGIRGSESHLTLSCAGGTPRGSCPCDRCSERVRPRPSIPGPHARQVLPAQHQRGAGPGPLPDAAPAGPSGGGPPCRPRPHP